MSTMQGSESETAERERWLAGSQVMTPERRAELAMKIVAMKHVSSAFYLGARAAGVHPFIEFTGLMNEWLQLCRAALDAGIDFTEISVHSSPKDGLPIQSFHAQYLGEKFGCIFVQWLREPEMLGKFLQAAELSVRDKVDHGVG